MEREGYQGGGSVGGKLGCGLAAITAVPLLGSAFVIASLGQCAADNQLDCVPHWLLFVGALLVIATVGFGTKAIVNAVVRRWRNGS
jgi:hypothetical protein